MTYKGLQSAVSDDAPHLGGNIKVGDPFTYCPTLWDYVIARFGIDSVLDLGSGSGYASFYFYRKGLKVIAVDGLESNVRTAIYPTIRHDLTLSPILTKVDLVHCHEVVEHIEEAFLDNLLSSLMCGRVILMTHAVPGQGGYHHVNLQPSEYWINHLVARGATYLEEDSQRIRRLAMSDGAVYMQATGMLFANSARIA